MKENGFFEEISEETLLHMVQKELDAAKEAQRNKKTFLPIKIIPAILLSGEFNRIPQNIWDEFAFLLCEIHKKKQGRPSTAHADKELANQYVGMRGKKAIGQLSESRNHTDERSTRRAIARGRKLVLEELREFITILDSELQKNGIEPTGNALSDISALAKLTDKKE